MGQPINKILQGVFDVLTFEKVHYFPCSFFSRLLWLTSPISQKRKPHLVGSLVSDPLGIFSKLKHFKTRLLAKNGDLCVRFSFSTFEPLADCYLRRPKLYFVKVDVRACFDTIQQDKLLEIVEEILTEVGSVSFRPFRPAQLTQSSSQTVYWIQKYSKVTPAGQHAGKQFKRQACTDSKLFFLSPPCSNLTIHFQR